MKSSLITPHSAVCSCFVVPPSQEAVYLGRQEALILDGQHLTQLGLDHAVLLNDASQCSLFISFPEKEAVYLGRQDTLVLDGQHLAQLECSPTHSTQSRGQPLCILVCQVSIEALLLGLVCWRKVVADLDGTPRWCMRDCGCQVSMSRQQ